MTEVWQHIRAIYEAETPAACFAAMDVAGATGYKYQQPIKDNGQIIPLVNLHRLNKFVGKSKKPAALKAAYAIGQVLYSPLGGIVVDRKLIQAASEGLPLISINPEYIPPEVTEMCPKCDDPVRYLPVCSCRWKR